MKPSIHMGLNRTGIDASPIDSKKTIEEAQKTAPTSSGTSEQIWIERAYFLEAPEPIGSIPPPATVSGVVQAGIQKVILNRPEQFINKLAERLAFERTGARLYETLINKCEEIEDDIPWLSLDTLYSFRDAERKHFHLVRQVMLNLGADPTALTPGADIVAVESLGLVQVLSDPRTTIAQCIHSILVAELTDNDGWETLIQIAEAQHQRGMAEQFREALLEEQRHLKTIKDYNQSFALEESKVA